MRGPESRSTSSRARARGGRPRSRRGRPDDGTRRSATGLRAVVSRSARRRWGSHQLGATMYTADTNPEYWSEYSNLQHVKHSVIKNYLNGWFPKMTLGPTGVRRLLYIDTHAGRGKHLEGQLGSPLVALTTLL